MILYVNYSDSSAVFAFIRFHVRGSSVDQLTPDSLVLLLTN